MVFVPRAQGKDLDVGSTGPLWSPRISPSPAGWGGDGGVVSLSRGDPGIVPCLNGEERLELIWLPKEGQHPRLRSREGRGEYKGGRTVPRGLVQSRH